MDKIIQCKVKKKEAKTVNQRIYYTEKEGAVTLQIGVWKKNEFTNETSITFDKEELKKLLNGVD